MLRRDGDVDCGVLKVMKNILCLLFMAALGLAGAEPVTICILGSNAGSEPKKGRHHTAWLLKYKENLYQFDAGESCAYTAHLAGYDMSQLRAVFISHPHQDHVCGLPHLIHVRNKMISKFKRKPAASPLPIYTPIPSLVTGLQDFLTATTCDRANYREGRNIIGKDVVDGVVYDDGIIKVEALHNTHCGPADKNGKWFAFSYKIEVAGKKIAYSGDIRRIEEMAPFLKDCDILLMENGHHRPWQIAETIRKTPGWNVRRLVFVHNGKWVREQPEETACKTRETWGKDAGFAFDGMTIKL